MAPFHAWKSAVAPGTVVILLQTVSIILLFIAGMLKKGFNRTSGWSPLRGGDQSFRTDAKCHESRIILGG
jgi:hypothetical protein